MHRITLVGVMGAERASGRALSLTQGPDLHQVHITFSQIPIKRAALCQDRRNAALAWKNGGCWDLWPDAFSTGAEMLIPEARVHT